MQFLKKIKKINFNFFTKQKTLSFLQKIGRSLVFPIAILPIAALMLRLGVLMTDTNLKGIKEFNFIWYVGSIFKYIGSAGIDNMASLFAIGVAFGLSKDNRGEAGLIGLFAWFILIGLMKIIPVLYYNSVLISDDLKNKSQLLYSLKNKEIYYSIDMGVFGGIIAGVVTALCYNKYHNIKLHPALSFFSGRRFVPIVVVGYVLGLTFVISALWPWMQFGLLKFGQLIAPQTVDESTRHIQWASAGLYVILNRLLLTIGLHHIINTYFWFQHPFTDTAGNIINGDINAFLHNNNGNLVAGAGVFQSGFFPIMMFGLPAAALAIIKCADADKKSDAKSLLLGASGVAFLTGVTEPLEFSFLYVAPVLYGIHILLSGIFSALTVGLGIRVGFGFSAGFIDYVLSFYQSMQIAKITWKDGISQILANPAWIFAIGLLSGTTYYFTFKFMINKFNYQTMGREKEVIIDSKEINNDINKKAKILIELLRIDNILNIENCTTRLRIKLKDATNVDLKQIKNIGFIATKKIDANNIQIIVGTDVQFISDELNKILKNNI